MSYILKKSNTSGVGLNCMELLELGLGIDI